MRRLLCKLKNKFVNSLLWFIVGVFFTIVIPLVINYVFTIPASSPWFAVDWEAKDALAFYGALLGATATILALHKTIKFTSESQREERKLSIKPRLETRIKDYTDSVLNLNDQSFVFVDFSNAIVSSSENLPSEIKDIIILIERAKQTKQNVNRQVDKYFADLSLNTCENLIKKYVKKHFLLLYEVYNYGANNAIEVKLRINEDLIHIPFCIPKDQAKRFVFAFNDDLLIDNSKKINISLVYTDICSIGIYEQNESFTIFKADSKFNKVQALEEQLSSPKEIEVHNKKK